MIYFTTLILTLLLAHIARAVPACGDGSPLEDMYDPIRNDEQLALGDSFNYKVRFDVKYDDKQRSTNTVSCKDFLQPKYKTFGSLSHFPDIGGAYFVRDGKKPSPQCGKCRKISNAKVPTKFFYFLAIDSVKEGENFVLSEQSYKKLTGGGTGPVDIEVEAVQPHFCGF